MSVEEDRHPQHRYEIQLEGYLDEEWAVWFDGLTLSHPDAQSTTLSGMLPDQTALHSVLNKIRDMNVTLKSIHRIQ